MKTLITIALVAMMLTVVVLVSGATRVSDDQFDASAIYKSKCVACHGKAAEKKFDPALSEAEMVAAVLKGKKGEKPPNMPSYEDKGINEEQAKAMIAYMKSLKQ
jgi:mono/diheme cytochrome c family protein